jgi:hypothetical protein
VRARVCAGPDANHTGGNVTGIPQAALVAMWEAPMEDGFAGCPDVRPAHQDRIAF